MDKTPAEYQKIMEMRNARNRFTQKLGIRLEALSAGYARVVKTVEEDDLNPLGRTHGGVYFTMADNAAGSAMSARGYMAVTLNASYSFFRSASVGERLIAEASEVKTGKTVCVYDVRVANQDGDLLGTGTFTFFQLDQKLEF